MAKFWTEEEDARLLEILNSGQDKAQAAVDLGRTADSVSRRIDRLNAMAKRDEAQRSKQRSASLVEAAKASPVEVDKDAIIRQLEADNARLREQKKWETHSGAETVAGGLLTLRRSDDHHGDDNHLLSCATSLGEKFLVVVEQYQPSRIQLIMGDDWIAGKGIFKEQDQQMAVPAIEQQIGLGAVKFRRFVLKIRGVTTAPISAVILRGNHEHANKLPVGNAMFYETRALCEDVPDFSMKLYNDRAVVNLAHTGDHSVLAMHGYGHSSISPNSPRFISDTKDLIIQYQRQGVQIRRVLSGHTHWLSVGIERLADLPYDTTGGLQRNNRVQLGMNNRPSGWIVYISPPDVPGEILQPIGLMPDGDTYAREIGDPHLHAANKADAADCLAEHSRLMRERGLIETDQFGLISEGRW